jgi:glycosyltransferase involved in cell wall biosynthesis
METADLGIIIPTMGIGEFLEESLVSVFKVGEQLDAVVVIVRPKKEGEIKLPRFNGRIHFVDDLEQAGLYPAINTGMRFLEENYEWKYFTYLNDDDILLPGFTFMMRNILRPQSIVDIGYGRCEFIVDRSEVTGAFTYENKPKRITSLFLANIVGIQQPGTVASKRMWKSCGPFDSSLKLCADMKFYFNVCDTSETFLVSRNIVSRFRIRKCQLSSDRKTVEAENNIIRDEILKGRSLGILDLFWIFLFRIKNLSRIRSSLLRKRIIRELES